MVSRPNGLADLVRLGGWIARSNRARFSLGSLISRPMGVARGHKRVLNTSANCSLTDFAVQIKMVAEHDVCS